MGWGGRRGGVSWSLVREGGDESHSLAARVRDLLKDLNPSFGEMAVGADLVGEARAEAAHDLSGLCLNWHALGLACPHLF